MMKSLIRFLSAAVAAHALFYGIVCSAEVITTEENYGPADYVYVAGNPDLYPIEYYDREAGEYRGLMPELFKRISGSGGISFAYVGAGEKDEREQLADNLQVDIVSAITVNTDESALAEDEKKVFGADINGGKTDIGIRFTDAIDPEVQKAVSEELSKITDADKLNIALSYTAAQPRQERANGWICLCAAISAFFVLTAVILAVVIKKSKAKYELASLTDNFTGLGNSDYFYYCYDNFIPEQARDIFFVIYMGFDNVRAENMLGSAECEDIIKSAAEKLQANVASAEHISYMGNGVFSLILQCRGKNEAAERTERILSSLQDLTTEDTAGKSGFFHAGICSLEETPGCGAQTALYNAKQGYLYAVNNNLRYSFSTSDIISANKTDEKIRRRINDAIKNDEFKPYIQFIIDLKTGEICGGELLSRWDNPELGLLTPGKYIYIMEQIGAITRHDYLMIEKLCRMLENWSGTEYGDLFLTCNFTRISLAESDFAERIKEISDKYKFDHNNLIIEVTEDSLSDSNVQSATNIRLCGEMGFRTAIDDMGSGYASISDLYYNEIDIVKVERNIVKEGVTEKGFKFLNGLIGLAHGMNAEVLCEGIETDEQEAMIKKTECDMVQGYLYSRVLPYDEAMEWLRNQRHR